MIIIIITTASTTPYSLTGTPTLGTQTYTPVTTTTQARGDEVLYTLQVESLAAPHSTHTNTNLTSSHPEPNITFLSLSTGLYHLKIRQSFHLSLSYNVLHVRFSSGH